MSEQRRATLIELLTLSRPLVEIARDLARYPWDGEVELVTLTPAHVEAILRRFLAGELAAKAVEDWANAIEFRDDVAYGEVMDLVHELANPILTEPLTFARAAALLDQTSQRGAIR